MIDLVIVCAVIAIGIFIYFNYASQKRKEKQEDRRDEINEKIEDLINDLKNKGSKV
jgi:phosphotransferase system  glucose/maltose/N-acetylglucosamine-specific IIC component